MEGVLHLLTDQLLVGNCGKVVVTIVRGIRSTVVAVPPFACDPLCCTAFLAARKWIATCPGNDELPSNDMSLHYASTEQVSYAVVQIRATNVDAHHEAGRENDDEYGKN